MSDLKGITLQNVKLRWAFLDKPDSGREFSSNKYQVDVIFDAKTKESVEKLINKKQQIKDNGDGTFTMCLKSSVKPRVLNSSKVLMTDDDIAKIGNDSLAHVRATQYVGFGKQIYLGLKSVMVVKLVEYSGEDDFADIEADNSDPFDTDDDEII